MRFFVGKLVEHERRSAPRRCGAKDLADKAYSVALNNAEDIKEMKNNNKWAWGYMIGLGITIIGYFLTKL